MPLFCPFLGCEAPYDPFYPSNTPYPPLNVTGATSIQMKLIVGLKYKKMMPYEVSSTIHTSQQYKI